MSGKYTFKNWQVCAHWCGFRRWNRLVVPPGAGDLPLYWRGLIPKRRSLPTKGPFPFFPNAG